MAALFENKMPLAANISFFGLLITIGKSITCNFFTNRYGLSAASKQPFYPFISAFPSAQNGPPSAPKQPFRRLIKGLLHHRIRPFNLQPHTANLPYAPFPAPHHSH